VTTKKAATQKTTQKAPAVHSPPQDKAVAISTRIPRAIHEELRRIAYKQRVTVHNLVFRALRLMKTLL
jgi:hypothetical protein